MPTTTHIYLSNPSELANKLEQVENSTLINLDSDYYSKALSPTIIIGIRSKRHLIKHLTNLTTADRGQALMALGPFIGPMLALWIKKGWQIPIQPECLTDPHVPIAETYQLDQNNKVWSFIVGASLGNIEEIEERWLKKSHNA